jgi:uncharacterized OB-fold protein
MLCNHCASPDLKWVEPTGRARVQALPVAGPQRRNGDSHNVVLIELEEGPRILAPVMGLAPEKVKIGMHVSAHISMIDGEHTLVFYGMEQGSNEW